MRDRAVRRRNGRETRVAPLSGAWLRFGVISAVLVLVCGVYGVEGAGFMGPTLDLFGSEASARLSLQETVERERALAQGQVETSKEADAVVKRKFGLSREVGGAEVAAAVQRLWTGLAEDLVLVYRSFGIDVASKVYQETSKVRRKLQTLQEGVSNKGKPVQVISPAFQWAQSPSSVFLSVKFAHKWDTPATLGCAAEMINVTATRVRFDAVCKSKRKHFSLAFDPFRPIDPLTADWSAGAVGRAMLTLHKATNASWPRLMRSKRKPANMHVWWDKASAHEQEMKDFLKEEDETAPTTAAVDAEGVTEEPISETELSDTTPEQVEEETREPTQDEYLAEFEQAWQEALAAELEQAQAPARAASVDRRKLFESESANTLAAELERVNKEKADIDRRAEQQKHSLDRALGEFRQQVRESVEAARMEEDARLNGDLADIEQRIRDKLLPDFKQTFAANHATHPLGPLPEAHK